MAEGPGAPGEDRGRVLLKLARESLVEAFGGTGKERLPAAPWLAEPRASFVTLRRGGELRGCVGSAVAVRPLAEDVWENARAAAFRDVRFPPLVADELPRLEIEVSLLSSLELLEVGSEEEACAALRPRVDGVVLDFGPRRGLLLPAVWEHLPSPRDFMAALKRKAGLDPAFWSPGVRLWRFSATEWRESELRGGGA